MEENGGTNVFDYSRLGEMLSKAVKKTYEDWREEEAWKVLNEGFSTDFSELVIEGEEEEVEDESSRVFLNEGKLIKDETVWEYPMTTVWVYKDDRGWMINWRWLYGYDAGMGEKEEKEVKRTFKGENHGKEFEFTLELNPEETIDYIVVGNDCRHSYQHIAVYEVLPEYYEFKCDDKVMVRIFNDIWLPRHFSHVDENGKPCCWVDGYTSFSYPKSYETPTTQWDECRKPTEEELK